MSAWWRVNRWSLLALVAILPIAAYAVLVPRAIPYQDSRPVYEEHALGDTVSYGGADFTLTSLDVLPGWRYDTGSETDLVVAIITVDVTDPRESTCDVRLVQSVEGVERSWNDDLFAGDYDVPDEAETLCSLSEAGEYELQQLYVVPRGVVTDPAVEVTLQEELPRALRLR